MNSYEIAIYCRQNQAAMLLMNRAAGDYIGSRCCLLNQVFSGLELGAQAVEKVFKAMLLFNDPNENIKMYSHSLQKLAKRIEELNLCRLDHFDEKLKKLESYFSSRYPDDPKGARSSSTGDIQYIDEIVLYCFEKLSAPIEVLMESGIYVRGLTPVISRIEKSGEEHWLTHKNPQFNAKVMMLAKIHHGIE
jgi:HEPN domain-containing protein